MVPRTAQQFFLAFLAASFALVAGKAIASEQWGLMEWHTSPCILQDPPNYAGQFQQTPYHLCTRGYSLTDTVISSPRKRFYYTNSSTLSVGLHWGPRQALLWEGDLQYRFLGIRTPPIFTYRDSRYAIYQFGKIPSDHFQISIGRQPLPFGVNAPPVQGYFDTWNPDYFWTSPRLGTVLAVDDGRSVTWQLGMGQDPGEGNNTQAFSTRLMYDLKHTYGARLIASFYANKLGNRRYGLAAVNQAPNGATAHVEFIRLHRRPDRKESHFQQLIRIAMLGPVTQKRQFFFLYDDIYLTHRLLTLGQVYYATSAFSSRIGLIYRKDEVANSYGWGLALGIGVHL